MKGVRGGLRVGSSGEPTRCLAAIALLALGLAAGSNGHAGQTISIDPNDDSCEPVGSEFDTCAEACEANALGCAQDIHSHINGAGFIDRRSLYPTTRAEQPNPTTPMHGLFNTMFVNQQARDAITAGISAPFRPFVFPAWSIVAKYNSNPTDDPEAPETWETHSYKIPGYCPKRADATANGECVGGEWFWFLYRNGYHVFDWDAELGGIPAYGKAEVYCLECHAAVSESDWMWIVHFERNRARHVSRPLRYDGHTPGDSGSGFCDTVKELSSNLPPDVLFDPATVPSMAQQMFDCYAWESFIALNWPADPSRRGAPDTGVPFNAPDRDRVWETYAQVYEAFQPQDPAWTLRDKSFDSPQTLPEVCAEALAEAPEGAFPGNPRTYQVLNEDGQAYGNQFDTLVDTNGNHIRYNIRFNETEWEFLRVNGFADTGTYDYQGPFGVEVVFPDNTSSQDALGAIEIKSSWKELCTDPKICDPLDAPSRFYSRYALIYDEAVEKQNGTVPASCRVAHVGLVGLHTMFKTFWAPQWIWATFEQIDNVPEVGQTIDPEGPRYTLFDPACADADITPQECLFQRPGITEPAYLACCENLQMLPNSLPDPNNPVPLNVTTPVNDLIPVQVTRATAIDQTAKDMTERFRALLAAENSPFQYYKLINTQWPREGRLGDSGVEGYDEDPYAVVQKLCLEGDEPPCYSLAPDGLRLRNTTMETYQVSWCKPDDENINNVPGDCSIDDVAEDPAQHGSAGCINCHTPAGADSSFVWEDAIWERVPTAVPEPAGALLHGVALMAVYAIAATRRRKKR